MDLVIQYQTIMTLRHLRETGMIFHLNYQKATNVQLLVLDKCLL